MNNLTQYAGNWEASLPQDSLIILRSFLQQKNEYLAQEISTPPLQQYFKIYPTHPNLLKNSLTWFDTLVFPQFSPRFLLECKTMLGEAVDNVRDHAHEHLPQDLPIPIVITSFAQMMSLQIWDQGTGFDLEARLASKKQWPDSGATRGRGLMILTELSNYLGYVRDHGLGNGLKNCLILVKFENPAA